MERRQENWPRICGDSKRSRMLTEGVCRGGLRYPQCFPRAHLRGLAPTLSGSVRGSVLRDTTCISGARLRGLIPTDRPLSQWPACTRLRPASWGPLPPDQRPGPASPPKPLRPRSRSRPGRCSRLRPEHPRARSATGECGGAGSCSSFLPTARFQSPGSCSGLSHLSFSET